MIIDQLPTISPPVQDTDELAIERGTQTYKVSVGNSFVKKTGDTMTGALQITGVTPNGDKIFGTKNENYGITSIPSSTQNDYLFIAYGSDDKMLGSIRDYISSTGQIGLSIFGRNEYNGSPVLNGLYLLVDSSGNRVVDFSDVVPWRKALGIGTNGALPITVAQGGTGATTAIGAIANLGLASLQAQQYTIANNASKAVDMANATHGFFLMTGAGDGTKGIYAYNCQSNGLTTIKVIGTAPSGITLTTATNRITIANAAGANCYVLHITY